MMLEAALAYVHLAAILSWVVFVSSTAALARIEWLNPAVVNRLVVVGRGPRGTDRLASASPEATKPGTWPGLLAASTPEDWRRVVCSISLSGSRS
ncbi:MAG: hypothetical protein IPP87_18045 [Ideonella sp.]|nr:hypothetical protein [Ideonella sp.]